ncbi:MAG TPA: Uma2 family endonuclease [Gammaproteobacteria bacterium]|nr:Uma2 family endonuclease [Gammaproteobacteria bacterium]
MSAQTESWPRPHRLTVDDYYRMAEVGLLHPDDRTELIEGEIIDMPPIGDRHAAVVRLLNTRLVRAVGDAAEVSSQLPVRLSLRSEPQPDFAVVKAKRGGYRKHPQPRDVLLLIEVSDSTLRYDLGKRASLYAAHGIPEYWVFDLQRDRVWRHRDPNNREYARVDAAESGTLTLPTLDADISLEELF